ncbi:MULTISPECIES: cytochrome P450 [unclassified Streptomyces]|uniref:cytochrome P450 n=1 Tax=unclassified Streptomyces TaxID=2593676 RepID=UPI002366EFCC|nr:MULTISPECIES: cytochrome P450 [unclassified Streptomyces]MDF3142042.1 cytochrome P450 [Streptomyces sp. T21Q-yed]WDF36190.1 cytochrome P450 [Streptomyces sp. T12]
MEDLPGLDFDPFLRESVRTAPVRRIRLPYGEGECWLVTRHEDVRFVTSDPRFTRDIVGRPTPRMTKHLIPLDRAVSFVDPPDHARVRSVVTPAFGRNAVEALRPRARQILDGLVDGLLEAGPPADLVRHVTSPFPMAVLGELVGIPEEDRPLVQQWAQTLLTRARDDAAAERAGQVKETARGYFLRLAARRCREPRRDLMTHLAAAVGEGRIDEEEMLALATLIALNGWHAVRNNTANMMYALLTHDGLVQRLRAQPQITPRAVEELLRWIPHKHGVGQPRIATQDVEVGGVLIREGEVVQVSYTAANWDDRCYPHPERIDFDRQGPAHLAFGHGPHHCVAPLLARMEAELLLTTLVTRLPELTLAVPAGQVPWQTDVLIRGPVELPVTW